MIKNCSTFPREGSAVLSKVALAIEALIESIEETAIKNFVEAFEEFELVSKDDSVGLIKVLRHFNDNGALFEVPKGIKDAIWNDHNIGLILILSL